MIKKNADPSGSAFFLLFARLWCILCQKGGVRAEKKLFPPREESASAFGRCWIEL